MFGYIQGPTIEKRWKYLGMTLKIKKTRERKKTRHLKVKSLKNMGAVK